MTATHPSATLTLDQAFQQAVTRHKAGDLNGAEQLYRAILQANPQHPDANHNLGVLAVQVQKPSVALPLFKTALEANPGQQQYWLSYIDALIKAGQPGAARQVIAQARKSELSGELFKKLEQHLGGAGSAPAVAAAPLATEQMLGTSDQSNQKQQPPAEGQIRHDLLQRKPAMQQLVALFNQCRYAEAEALAQALTERFPDYGLGWKGLGFAYRQQGKIAESLLPMQKAVNLLPRDAEAHNNLATTLMDLDRPQEAEARCRKALQIRPDYAEAHYNLGNAHKGLEQLKEAETSYRRALQINPDLAEAHYNLGNTLMLLERLKDAEAHYRRALQIRPDYVEAHHNLGNVLTKLGQLKEAEASYRLALQIRPNYAEAHYELGNTLKDLGNLNLAEVSYRRALELKPDSAETYWNLGNTLRDLGRLDEAVTSYRKTLQINPNYADAYTCLLFALNYHPNKSAEEIFNTYRGYDQRFGIPHHVEWPVHRNIRTVERRLRVGYVSPDFRRHSCRHFIEPLLAAHDRSVIELFAFAELKQQDAYTARYQPLFEHWIPTADMSDSTLAERIQASEIDILVDLAGHTAGNRLGVFARKPAPVQVSWLGYGYTTGLTAIDYYLTDEVCAPQGSEHLFSETPWRLNPASLCYQAAEGMGEVSPLPALERGYITFGTLTRSVRINHRTVRVWAQILKQLPTAQLVIDSGSFRDETLCNILQQKFASHDISAERLHIGCHTPPWDLLRGIDIGLDCFPHNSGTTLFESLYLGVPFITLAGRPSVGRLGASILTGLGHPELVADSEDKYIEKAVALACDTSRLSELRGILRQEMLTSPLMDPVGFARKVETAYREMWKIWMGRKL